MIHRFRHFPACFLYGSLALLTGLTDLMTGQCWAEQPNIVFILADDLGYGELGCYGQEKIRTPNLDRLASQGIRFTQHYSGAPTCAPSRCVLLTGQHLAHSEIRGYSEELTHI